MSRARAGWLGLALACAAAVSPARAAAPNDLWAAARADLRADTRPHVQADEGALAEGHRRFQQGDLEGAFAAYSAAYDPARPDPTVAYDLGATAHRLGRLPEAVLWYRRAQRHPLLPLPSERWTDDNLALARDALGAPRLPPRGLAWWAAHRDALTLAACLLAWGALGAELAGVLRGRRGRGDRRGHGAALALALAGALVFAAGWLLAAKGPRSAVLLAPCAGLPAGTEVWVERSAQAAFRLLGEIDEPACPAEIVGLVDP